MFNIKKIMFKNSKSAKVFAGVVGFAMVVAAFGAVVAPVKAQVTSPTDLASLIALIASLEAQIAALQGVSPSVRMTGSVPTAPLTMGSSGAEVTKLQDLLIWEGFGPAAGATGYFGPQTKAALMAYQAANGISPAVGYYGSVTAAKIASMLAGLALANPAWKMYQNEKYMFEVNYPINLQFSTALNVGMWGGGIPATDESRWTIFDPLQFGVSEIVGLKEPIRFSAQPEKNFIGYENLINFKRQGSRDKITPFTLGDAKGFINHSDLFSTREAMMIWKSGYVFLFPLEFGYVLVPDLCGQDCQTAYNNLSLTAQHIISTFKFIR